MPDYFENNLDNGGLKGNVFLPPSTPSAASSLYMTHSTNSLFSIGSDRLSMAGRKRARNDYIYDDISMGESGDMDPGSPLPFVNTRYLIAGGLDTPTATRYGDDQELSDLNYRQNVPSKKRGLDHEDSFSFFPPLPEVPSLHLTQPSQDPSSQSTATSISSAWSRTALNVVGIAVGKVWDFCTAGAFRGFTAGGGSKYEIKPDSRLTTEESVWEETNEGRQTFTPVPGQFPEEGYIRDYMNHITPENSPNRPAKRRQISTEDSLNKNWVVVSSEISATPPITPTASKPPRIARYTKPTASSAGRRPSLMRTTSRPASSAGMRGTASTARIAGVSHAGSPALRSSRPASFASPRSPGGSRLPVPKRATSTVTTAPSMSPAAREAARDAAKWAAQRRKQEREEDESMQRFNAQLQAMIREGKEALGTRVQVDLDDGHGVDVDEGFEDGDYHGLGKRW